MQRRDADTGGDSAACLLMDLLQFAHGFRFHTLCKVFSLILLFHLSVTGQRRIISRDIKGIIINKISKLIT